MSDRAKSLFQRLAGFNLSPFWETMSRNWTLKLICLGLAFAVWQGIRESNSYEVVVQEVPVKISTEDGLAVLEQSTDVVSIRFRGSRDDIRYISRDQVGLALRIEDRSRLRQTLKLSPRYVRAPSRAHAVQFMPPEVTVTMDREVERLLPVKASMDGELPNGIHLEQAICDPASVRVRGAERQLVSLEQVYTEPISMDGRYNSFSTHVRIADDGQVWVATPDRVSVAINLMEHVDTRTFEGLPVRFLAAQDSWTVDIAPKTVRVVLRGSSDTLAALEKKDIFVYVDGVHITEKTEYDLPFRVDVPVGIEVEQKEPAVVKVTVKTL